MKSLEQIIDDAKAKTGCNSYRQLSMKLGFSPTAISQFRRRRALPSDETMIDLCNAADVDPVPYLVELAKWRAAWNGDASTWAYWDKIGQAVARVAVWIFFATAGVAGVGGFTMVQKANASTSVDSGSYIMRQKRRRRERGKARNSAD
jgi:transcriptional regulator with XRE-family HTH domain